MVALPSPSKHAGGIGPFDTEFVVKGAFSRKLSRDFHKAFELRQAFDYRVLQSPTREQAEDAWQRATRFLRAVKEHLRDAEAGKG